MRSTINNIKYISRDGSRKKENETSNNFGKPMNSNFLKSNQNYFSNNNFNMKSMGMKENPMNRHQRYKSQNIEINTDFNKINSGEENNKNERNIYGKFSPLNSKDFNGIQIKNSYNISNNMGNFTSNNFNFGGNNKFIKCKGKLLLLKILLNFFDNFSLIIFNKLKIFTF